MTTGETCKAVTASGERCRIKAGDSGYCHLHDPEKIAARVEANETAKKAWKEKYAKGEEFREIIDKIETVCDRRGWVLTDRVLDHDDWSYAALSIRHSSLGDSLSRVTALIEINSNVEHRSITYQPTSVYTYGLKTLWDAIQAELREFGFKPTRTPQKPESRDSFQDVKRIIDRFHIVVRQLSYRHADRNTILINDEYDVQDVLHGLLKLFFDDIRAEEYTPSYAGSASRLDFLLKKEQIVIETKYATAKLRDREVGEQLIIDIQRYQSHPDCKTLVCFVYDPAQYVSNPTGLESDLGGKQDDLAVHVFIRQH